MASDQQGSCSHFGNDSSNQLAGPSHEVWSFSLMCPKPPKICAETWIIVRGDAQYMKDYNELSWHKASCSRVITCCDFVLNDQSTPDRWLYQFELWWLCSVTLSAYSFCQLSEISITVTNILINRSNQQIFFLIRNKFEKSIVPKNQDWRKNSFLSST